mmetsp:Transcript_44112/g.68972  ORF Transcript_44112/g.68972 Transcript_44112/m.68972 type:complete len:113 (-) Transcript_44112:620-958(-)
MVSVKEVPRGGVHQGEQAGHPVGRQGAVSGHRALVVRKVVQALSSGAAGSRAEGARVAVGQMDWTMVAHQPYSEAALDQRLQLQDTPRNPVPAAERLDDEQVLSADTLPQSA